jgi:hypothetical protein
MTNPTLEFLQDLIGKKVLVTESFKEIKCGNKIVLKNFETNEKEVILKFEHKNQEFIHVVNWKDNLPFTQFLSSKSAYFHAKRVKKRFNPEIENVVFKRSPKILFLYAISFLKEKFPKNLEKIIVQNPYYAYKYAKNFLDGRLTQEQEKIFFKDSTGESLVFYAIEVVKEKLPDELHNFLLLKSIEKSISSYTKNLIIRYFKMCDPDEFSELPQEKINKWNYTPSTKTFNNNKNFLKIYKK